MKSIRLRWLGLVLCGLVGCGNRNEIELVKVSGRVTLDDQPLEKGLIQFLPIDGKSPSAACEIRLGEYHAEVPVGNKRVEVTSPKIIGQQKAYDTPDSPVMDLLAEQVPLQYNAQSQLKVNVTRQDKKFDFGLKSRLER